MRAFVTGASGWIGTALTTELIAAGHEVRGLVRSDASAERVRRLGVTPVMGDMADHDLLVAEARAADATAHLAFTLDFDAFDAAVDNEVRLLDRIGDALQGTGTAFFAASGTPTSLGRLATERDELDPAGPAGVRSRTARAVLDLSQRGIRSGLVRMPRTVHGQGDRDGLIAALVGIDRQLGTAAYVGDGTNRWPAVHDVAEAIARKTGLTASAVDPEQLGVFGALLGGDQPASSVATRELVDWEPTGPTLLDDIEAGYYTS
jgi:nucleoside-diphosphate-sugar epimerase